MIAGNSRWNVSRKAHEVSDSAPISQGRPIGDGDERICRQKAAILEELKEFSRSETIGSDQLRVKDQDGHTTGMPVFSILQSGCAAWRMTLMSLLIYSDRVKDTCKPRGGTPASKAVWDLIVQSRIMNESLGRSMWAARRVKSAWEEDLHPWKKQCFPEATF